MRSFNALISSHVMSVAPAVGTGIDVVIAGVTKVVDVAAAGVQTFKCWHASSYSPHLCANKMFRMHWKKFHQDVCMLGSVMTERWKIYFGSQISNLCAILSELEFHIPKIHSNLNPVWGGNEDYNLVEHPTAWGKKSYEDGGEPGPSRSVPNDLQITGN